MEIGRDGGRSTERGWRAAVEGYMRKGKQTHARRVEAVLVVWFGRFVQPIQLQTYSYILVHGLMLTWLSPLSLSLSYSMCCKKKGGGGE